ncbi:MAG: pyridoxamine 5'-phosphate oxidase family protein [Candidatus Limnocylindrales bacterium]
MSDLRPGPIRAADARSILQANPDGWLATGAPEGRPHLIAVSTCWTGSEVVIATLAASRTARNLEATRTARLALGAPDDVVMLDLELAANDAVDPAGGGLTGEFARGVGWSPGDEPGQWRLFRLRPRRIQAFRGYGAMVRGTA